MQHTFLAFMRLSGCLIVLFQATVSYAATLYVATSGVDAGSCPIGAPCATINYAHSQAAASGDTISVAAGTFAAEVVLSKSLVLTGAGSTTTIIKAPVAALTIRPQIPPGAGGQASAIVWVNGGSTTISNLEIQGPGSGPCGTIGFGVFAGNNAALTFTGNRVTRIRDNPENPLSGCQNGIGIRLGANATGQVATGSITNNVFTTYQKGAIVVDNAGSAAIVSGNTITGELPAPIIAQNGIQISRGATATVIGNTVSSHQCSATNPLCGPGFDASWSTGVLLFNAGTTSITNNTLSNNDAGVLASNGAGSGSATLTGNTLIDNRVGVSAAAGTLDLLGNTITGGNYGVLSAAYVASSASSVINLNGGNIVSGALIAGVSVYDQSLVDANTAGIFGSGNQFVGNTFGASNNPAQGTVSLGCNWWGSPFGPVNSANPLGAGNPTTTNTIFTNWATNNTSFTCNGNVTNNDLLVNRAVPTLSTWLLLSMAALLAWVAVRSSRRRTTQPVRH
jgi:hypothetical protein